MVARETYIAEGLAQMGIRTGPTVAARLARFAEILADKAIPLGYIGPNEADRILPRHIFEACALLPWLPSGSLIDVGSGAGLPGLVLACLGRHDVSLLEAHERRADFLRESVDVLELDVTVIVGRAEELGRTDLRDSFAAAVARALAEPAVAMELCLPFVAVGGSFVSAITPYPGGDASTEGVREEEPPVDPFSAARLGSALDPVARALGAAAPRMVTLEVPGASVPRWGMIVDKLEPTPPRFPRRTGVPKRRPLA